MSKPNSYGLILRSSSIIGGASVANILIGLLRMKVAALLLGPAGIGLIGLMQNLTTTATSVAGLGIGMSATRQVAEAAGRRDTTGLLACRRALAWGTGALAITGAMTFWILREPIARLAMASEHHASAVGWLAIGVAASVIAASAMALLNGHRRIADIARVNVFAALVSTLLGLGALLAWGADGIVAFVLVLPIATLAFAAWYAGKMPRAGAAEPTVGETWSQWTAMFRLGAAFMLSAVVLNFGQLAVRAMVQHRLGEAALGLFQASWLISMTYIGFVLGAMATDYYPRLTAVIGDRKAANRLVNQQTEAALLLAGPLVLAMLGAAPWVLQLLYSADFVAAAQVLRWQVLGDLLKIASWPLGFIILAAGHGRTFVLTEALAMGVFAGLTWIGLPHLGVEATGVAFLGMYAAYLPVVYLVARRITALRWRPGVVHAVGHICVAAVLVHVLAMLSSIAGLIVGLLLAVVFFLRAARRLGRHLPPPFARIAVRIGNFRRG